MPFLRFVGVRFVGVPAQTGVVFGHEGVVPSVFGVVFAHEGVVEGRGRRRRRHDGCVVGTCNLTSVRRRNELVRRSNFLFLKSVRRSSVR